MQCVLGEGAVCAGGGCSVGWGRVQCVLGEVAVCAGGGCSVCWGRGAVCAGGGVQCVLGEGAVCAGGGCSVGWGEGCSVLALLGEGAVHDNSPPPAPPPSAKEFSSRYMPTVPAVHRAEAEELVGALLSPHTSSPTPVAPSSFLERHRGTACPVRLSDLAFKQLLSFMQVR